MTAGSWTRRSWSGCWSRTRPTSTGASTTAWTRPRGPPAGRAGPAGPGPQGGGATGRGGRRPRSARRRPRTDSGPRSRNRPHCGGSAATTPSLSRLALTPADPRGASFDNSPTSGNSRIVVVLVSIRPAVDPAQAGAHGTPPGSRGPSSEAGCVVPRQTIRPGRHPCHLAKPSPKDERRSPKAIVLRQTSRLRRAGSGVTWAAIWVRLCRRGAPGRASPRGPPHHPSVGPTARASSRVSLAVPVRPEPRYRASRHACTAARRQPPSRPAVMTVFMRS
jgi:hypothetical protein